MPLASRLFCAGLVGAALLAGPLASPAVGDERTCGAPSRPACTILRPPPLAAVTRPASFGPECVVLVGGLGSKTSEEDGFFEPVLAALDPGLYRRVHFGVEPGTLGHPYLTYGAIDRNAEQLLSLIRDLSRECRAIHLIAHSMGGAVADRAFSMDGLAAAGVVTYIALSSPHNGATGARAVRRGVEADGIFAAAIGAATRAVHVHDPTSDAVRDLARIHAPRPLRDVDAVRLRLTTDEIVLRRDHVDRRVDVREIRPGSPRQALEGHGGVIANAEVQDLVGVAIRSHRVPPDRRSAAELMEAGAESRLWDRVLARVDDAIGLAMLAAARATGAALAAPEIAATAAAEVARRRGR